ncbi:hypothetical protein BMETH_38711811562, partial [methanotrophic bacterial endosymbiont of Bathymodiolus sp.]
SGNSVYGNTPTGVGKTTSASILLKTPWKHPHGRGEDYDAGDMPSGIKETPPRAWGRHLR